MSIRSVPLLLTIDQLHVVAQFIGGDRRPRVVSVVEVRKNNTRKIFAVIAETRGDRLELVLVIDKNEAIKSNTLQADI